MKREITNTTGSAVERKAHHLAFIEPEMAHSPVARFRWALVALFRSYADAFIATAYAQPLQPLRYATAAALSVSAVSKR